jgi:membrane protein
MTVSLQRLPRWHVGRFDVTGIARDTAREISDDDVPGLAAEMAYHSVLAIFPFLLFLAGLTSVVDNVFSTGNLTDRIVEKAGQVMPEDAQSVLRGFTDEVLNSEGGGAITVGLLGALWAASSAVGSAMKALNRAYDVKETRGFVKKKALAVLITVVFVSLTLAGGVLLSTGAVMAGGIGGALGWGDEVSRLYGWATIPGALILIGFAVAILYWLAPNTEHKFAWISPGAALFIVAWMIASLAFAYYVSNFGSYNRTYGSIGAVILLLVWLYWTNFILLVGGELNAVLAKRHDPEYRSEQGARPSDAGSRANP